MLRSDDGANDLVLLEDRLVLESLEGGRSTQISKRKSRRRCYHCSKES